MYWSYSLKEFHIIQIFIFYIKVLLPVEPFTLPPLFTTKGYNFFHGCYIVNMLLLLCNDKLMMWKWRVNVLCWASSANRLQCSLLTWSNVLDRISSIYFLTFHNTWGNNSFNVLSKCHSFLPIMWKDILSQQMFWPQTGALGS